MKFTTARLLLGTGMVLAAASAFAANDWGNVAMVSTTMGANANRICIGEGLRISDIGCPSYAPSITTAGDVSVTGNLSAAKFIGDGSGLTGITAASSDRIVSGTTSLVAISNTGYVSLTQSGVNTGWFNPQTGFVTIGVSSTGAVSGSSGYLTSRLAIGSPTTSLELGIKGASAFAGMEIFDSTNNRFLSQWNSGSGGFNLGTVSNKPLLLMANDVKAVTVDTNGKVGIGEWMNSPKATLQVSGTFIVSNSTQVTTPSIYVSSGTGNVGIGTNNPSSSLEVGVSNTWAFMVGTNYTNPAFRVDSSQSNKGLFVSGNGLYAVGSSVPLNLYGAGGNLNFATCSNCNVGFSVGQGTISLGNGGNDSVASNIRLNLRAVFNDTNLTAGTEAPAALIDLNATRTHSTGAITTQRDMRVIGTRHAFNAASTIQNSAVFSVDAPNTSGNNATINYSSAIYVPGIAPQTNSGTVVNTYGLLAYATTFGSNNYAASFMGGNVGVGTLSPTTALDVSGTISATNLVINGQTITGGASGDRITSGTSSVVVNSATSTISFSTAGAHRMTIDGSGNVGIGTTAPGNKLHVYATSNAGGLTLDGTANPALALATTGSVVSYFGVVTSLNAYTNGTVANDIALQLTQGANSFYVGKGNATPGLSVKASGSVGIGTTLPSQTLDVSGTARIASNTAIGMDATPSATLDVSGTLKIAGTGSESCNGTTLGMFRRNPTTGDIQVCASR